MFDSFLSLSSHSVSLCDNFFGHFLSIFGHTSLVVMLFLFAVILFPLMAILHVFAVIFLSLRSLCIPLR